MAAIPALRSIGSFTEADGVISAEIRMSRHNHDPNYVPMFDVDNIVLISRAARRGEEIHFEGGSAALPGVRFKTVLTPISEADAPPPGAVGPDGIGNGLYSIHIRMLDGIDGGNTGVMVLHDGRIRGGDAFFDYIGAYTAANGKWKGELVNREHTPSQGRTAAVRRPRGRHRLFRHLRRRRRGRRSHRARRQAQHPLQGGAAKAGGD